MSDCRAGRIDLIVTKSMARISRNLGKTMEVVRELAYMKPPVGVYFEDINMNTLEKEKYLFLSVFEALSIHESDSKGNSFLAKYNKLKEKLKKNDSDDE